MPSLNSCHVRRDALAERLVQARPGIPVARLIAEGAVDVGVQQLSELVGEPGVRILGTLPEDCAITTVFAGAVATSADQPHDAVRMLGFFTSVAAARIITAGSFGLPGAGPSAASQRRVT